MIARHLSGEPRAFEELVECFGGPVYAFFQRQGVEPSAAEDLFQETFLRVHRSARRYDPERPFRAWLYTIAHNLLRSHWRARRVRRVLGGWWRRGEGRARDPESDCVPADRRLDARQRVRFIESALQDLPVGQRQALYLARVEGLAVADCARVLGVPVPTAKTWLRRARLALADALERWERGEPKGVEP
ncbi:MAG: RNA polymerase sigma factor [Deltaproteobacteria bacterium]|nr:RNA polymerase sigma factor [Deltaproteobacteria bacterium]